MLLIWRSVLIVSIVIGVASGIALLVLPPDRVAISAGFLAVDIILVFIARQLIYRAMINRLREKYMSGKSNLYKEAMRRNPELAARLVGGEFYRERTGDPSSTS